MPAGVSAWTPLANITLASTANTVTFSSISGAYKDLRIVLIGGSNGTSGGGCRYTINGDTSSTYLWVTAEANGSASSSAWNGDSYVVTFNNYILWGYDSAPNTSVTIDFLDYSATDKHKTILSRGNNAARPATNMMTVRWPSTSAINTISFSAIAGYFIAGSTFALYGVSA